MVTPVYNRNTELYSGKPNLLTSACVHSIMNSTTNPSLNYCIRLVLKYFKEQAR